MLKTFNFNFRQLYYSVANVIVLIAFMCSFYAALSSIADLLFITDKDTNQIIIEIKKSLTKNGTFSILCLVIFFGTDSEQEKK